MEATEAFLELDAVFDRHVYPNRQGVHDIRIRVHVTAVSLLALPILNCSDDDRLCQGAAKDQAAYRVMAVHT